MWKPGRGQDSYGAEVPETESTRDTASLTDTGELRAACRVHLIMTTGTEMQIYADTFFLFFSWNTV